MQDPPNSSALRLQLQKPTSDIAAPHLNIGQPLQRSNWHCFFSIDAALMGKIPLGNESKNKKPLISLTYDDTTWSQSQWIPFM